MAPPRKLPPLPLWERGAGGAHKARVSPAKYRKCRTCKIVKLASHDILAVREAAWQMCRASLGRLKQDMATATQLVDARWSGRWRCAVEFK